MIVQTYFPQKLSPTRYDAYLASGWFRGSIMLYKMDLLCLEKDIFSVVNIRLNLDEHEFRSRHKRLLRKNDKRFRVSICKAQPNVSKEELYEKQKSRFKGFIHSSLDDYLYQGHLQSPFSTYEVNVYDGHRLVAASMFDIGEKSIASLIGMQDPEYAKYSLGIYTMLKEIEHSNLLGLKWYYPGYVLDRPSSFNYKLTLGTFEHYNTNKRWSTYSKFNPEDSVASKFKKKLSRLEDCFRHHAIECDSWLYPYFSMGYMGYWNVEFLRAPKYLEIMTGIQGLHLVAYFDIEKQVYVVAWLEGSESHDHLINMEMSGEFLAEDGYMMKLMEVTRPVCESHDPVFIAAEIKNLVSKSGTQIHGSHNS